MKPHEFMRTINIFRSVKRWPAALTVALLPVCGAAQSASTWVTLGLGKSTFFTARGISTNLAVSYQRGHTIFTFRRLSTSEFVFAGVEPREPRPGEWQADYAVMYGRTMSQTNSNVGLSAGIGLVTGLQRGKQILGLDYESSTISTLGLALQAHAIAIPLPWCGLGVSAGCNVNPRRSFGSVTLNLHLGDFR